MGQTLDGVLWMILVAALGLVSALGAYIWRSLEARIKEQDGRIKELQTAQHSTELWIAKAATKDDLERLIDKAFDRMRNEITLLLDAKNSNRHS